MSSALIVSCLGTSSAVFFVAISTVINFSKKQFLGQELVLIVLVPGHCLFFCLFFIARHVMLLHT